MPDFRLACSVRLRLRLDEGASRRNIQPPEPEEGAEGNPAEPARTAPGATSTGAAEQRRRIASQKAAQAPLRGRVPEASLEAESLQLTRDLQALQGDVGGDPGAFGSGADPERLVDVAVRPLSVSYERPSLSDAAKATISLDYRAFPVDPRAVRSCGVVIQIGPVDAQAFAEGNLGARRGFQGTAEAADRRPFLGEIPGEGARFEGWVDTWDIELAEGGDAITLECRDYSAVLRDKRVPRGVQIDQTKDLLTGVQEFIDRFATTRGFVVVFGPAVRLTREQESQLFQDPNVRNTAGSAPPVPITSLGTLAKSKGGKQAKAKRQGNTEQSVWDAIQVLCLRLGYQPVVRGKILFLQEPQAQFRAAQPYLAVYGQNLSTLKFTRKLQGVANKTIEIRSPDPTIGATRWARYPVARPAPSARSGFENVSESGILGDPTSRQPQARREAKIAPSGRSEDDVLVFQFPSIADLPTLERIARSLYEQISRQEVQGEFQTHDIEVLRLVPRGANSTEVVRAGFLELFPGDSVLALVTRGRPVATVLQQSRTIVENSCIELTRQAVARRARFFEQLGLDGGAAQRIAAALENVPIANKFQVYSTSLSWSSTDGYSLTVGFRNFLGVRDEPADEAVRAEQTSAALSAFAAELPSLGAPGSLSVIASDVRRGAL